MKIKIIVISVGIIVVMAVYGFDSFVKLGDVTICSQALNNVCSNDESFFRPDTSAIIMNYRFNDLKKGEVIKVKWLRSNGTSFAVNQYKVEENGDGLARFTLKKPVSGWDIGDFSLKVLLQENDRLLAEKKFSIES